MVCVAVAHRSEQRIEVREALGFDQTPIRFDPQQIERGPRDDPGETHSTDRGPEQIGLGLRPNCAF